MSEWISTDTPPLSEVPVWVAYRAVLLPDEKTFMFLAVKTEDEWGWRKVTNPRWDGNQWFVYACSEPLEFPPLFWMPLPQPPAGLA